MEARITIGNKNADIGENPVAINYKYLDLLEGLDERSQPYSSSITLPYTARNKFIFGFGDVVGSDLSKARGVYDVDFWLGPVKVINKGTLKLLDMDDRGYNCCISGRNQLISRLQGIKIETVLDQFVGTHVNSTFVTAINDLASGTKGFLLARDLHEDINSTNWNIYNNLLNGHWINHWLWFSVSKILETAETLGQCSFKMVFGGGDGTISTIFGSSLETVYFKKMYVPGYAYYLKYDGSMFWDITKDKSSLEKDSFVFGGSYVPRSDFRVFGDRTVWDLLTYLAKMFCFSIIVDSESDEVIICLTNVINKNTPVNLSGKIIGKPKKVPYLEGYAPINKIFYGQSDNIVKDYNAIILTSPIISTEETKELFTLDLIFPGLYYNSFLGDHLFKINLSSNKKLLSEPFILYANGNTASTRVIQNYSGDVYERTANLEKLRAVNSTSYYDALRSFLNIGEVYECEMALNIYDYSKLVPYKYVKIEELGGNFYLNKIENWNPDKPAKVQLIKAERL